MIKRTMILLLCVILIAALCSGCSFGSGENKQEVPPPETSSDTEGSATDEVTSAPAETATDIPSVPVEDAVPSDDEYTGTQDISEDTGVPADGIPDQEDADDELFDPDEISGTADSPEPAETGEAAEGDVGTYTGDGTSEDSGETVLP